MPPNVQLRGEPKELTAVTTRSRKRIRNRALTVAAAAATLAALATSAWGTAFYNVVPTINYQNNCEKGDQYDNGTVCRTDNLYWTAFRENSLSSAEKDRVKQVLPEQFGPTKLDVHFVTDPVWQGDNETDVIFSQGDVPGSLVGIAWCDDPMEGHECDQHMARIQRDSYSLGVICHEAGHAVGLLHGQYARPPVSNTDDQLGCMKNPAPGGAVLGSVNRDNINEAY
jgi:hypothetical protein